MIIITPSSSLRARYKVHKVANLQEMMARRANISLQTLLTHQDTVGHFMSRQDTSLYVTAGHRRTLYVTGCASMSMQTQQDRMSLQDTAMHCMHCVPIHGTALQFMARPCIDGKIGEPYSLNAPNRKYICQGYFCTSQYTNGSCSFFFALNTGGCQFSR